MKILAASILLAATLVASPVSAAPVTYAFDTVTDLQMDVFQPTLSGLAKDTMAPLSVTWYESSITWRHVANRCLALFMTALEKPGRYFVYVTVDAEQVFTVGLRSCRLEVKT